MIRFKLILPLLLLSFFIYGQNNIDISGYWQVNLDKENELVKKFSDRCKTEGTIVLPASLAQQGFGYQTEGSDYGILTPEYKYIGKAWYERQIEIPESWTGKNIELFLERVLWESRVIIDGKEFSRKDALGTPHIHELGAISPGVHEIVILVDNEMIHNIGDKGHAYGEYTQSIWNGIVGKMELRAYDPLRILDIKTFPEVKNDQLQIKAKIESPTSTTTQMNFEIHGLDGAKKISVMESIALKSGIHDYEFQLAVNDKLELWGEFKPVVYQLLTSIKSNDFSSEYETEFGYQQVSHDGTKILINGKPIFLRGNLDCVHFPLTGYPSCDIDDWVKIFNIYKDYGLNHARFHSWCPPEAAFKAADRVGIYLQAEASIWIDWWMSEDMILKGRPEMDTKGHPKGLGLDATRDEFVIQEMNRVVDTYGNHPSFSMFCIGNELGNSNFKTMEKWVAKLKEKDPRRLYAVSTARKIMDVDDYMATHYIQKIGRTRGLNGAHTDWDFEEVYAKMDIPIIAHEIGQWPVYPRWSEIDKYAGVLKAKNFEEFKAQAEKSGIGDQDDDFARASGALNQIMYKYETESFLRTASCAGVQLLSMQDYQGQGEALIGWLDAHWESKGITTPEKFREHFNTTVPLMRVEKFVWTNDETFNAKAQISHHGEKSIEGQCSWRIGSEDDELMAQGDFGLHQLPLGSLTDLGEISFDLQLVDKAEKLTISIAMEGTEFRNEWDFWVYPKSTQEINSDVLIAEEINEEVHQKLKSGGKVLVLAHQLGSETNSVHAQFYPLYWSLTFFPGQGKTNIGLLLDEDHDAFETFPTSFHSDWQWESISEDAKGFILNDLPKDYRPIAQPVDDFHRNNKVGSIFELKIGKGSMLVCGYNLESGLPVANQLKKGLLSYMGSPAFNPSQSVDYSWLQKTFIAIPEARTISGVKSDQDAILSIEAARLLDKESVSVPWELRFDVIKSKEEITYSVEADVWKDNKGSAWHGKEMFVQINCPAGMLGSLYVHFDDWNKNDRKGVVEFEGRTAKLGDHKKGAWVKFHVMREDSNDGKLILKTKATNGPNLMITDVILEKE